MKLVTTALEWTYQAGETDVRAERLYTIAQWTEMPSGAHFVAMEEPELLARDCERGMSNKPVLCIQVNEETQLRLFEERHVEDYFALIQRNQAYLHEWIAVAAYEGPAETLRAYVKQRLLHFINGEAYHLGIWYQEALVGILDYRLNWRSRTVELGYWLDAAMQGKGIVTAACRTMVRHAFEEHQMHKVMISCATDNPRSRAVAERLGFLQEGILRQADRLHDRYVDVVFYGQLKEEWHAEAEQAKADRTSKPIDEA